MSFAGKELPAEKRAEWLSTISAAIPFEVSAELTDNFSSHKNKAREIAVFVRKGAAPPVSTPTAKAQPKAAAAAKKPAAAATKTAEATKTANTAVPDKAALGRRQISERKSSGPNFSRPIVVFHHFSTKIA